MTVKTSYRLSLDRTSFVKYLTDLSSDLWIGRSSKPTTRTCEKTRDKYELYFGLSESVSDSEEFNTFIVASIDG